MKISFNTKEQGNDAQRDDILKLSHSDRFDAWLRLMHRTKQLLTPKEPENGNFLVFIKSR